MNEIVAKIQSEITQNYYKQNYSNDGQRFVAWYLRNIHLLDGLQAKDAVTDGSKDKQIDAVVIDEMEQKIYIIQGKFYTGDHIGAEPVREIISAWSQFGNIAKMQEQANGRLKIKLAEVAKALEEDEYTVCFELITTSMFTAEAQNDINAFQAKLSEEESTDINSEFIAIDAEDIAGNYSRALEECNPTLNHTVQFEAGKYLLTELNATKVIIAAIPLRECIEMPGIKNGTLFQKNVRQCLGINNTVNKKIKKTIYGDRCNDFFFFHNGITAICNKIEDKGNDRICFYGLSVVNGCQSLNTIISCSEKVKTQPEAYVLFRFYEIPQRDRADSISINTNTQSAVKARDLRSNDKRVLRLKRSYEQKYPNGFFATKRGDVTPADKAEEYTVELSALGKWLMAWYAQRPNLSYGETKIFDKYFNTLFKTEYSPEDIYAMKFWMDRIMEIWTEENPKGLDVIYLTMKAYAPFHCLYAISGVFAKCNNQSNVPSPAECLRLAQQSQLVDFVVSMAVNCLNTALSQETASVTQDDKTFIPQNWVKNKSSIKAIQTAIINYFTFLPTMNAEMDKKIRAGLKMDQKFFSYRVKSDE